MVAVIPVEVDAVGLERLLDGNERDGQRRLGHSITREKRFGLHPGGRHGGDEGAHRLRIDRLRPATKDAYPRQVPARDLLRPRPLGDQRVCEVGRERQRPPVLVQSLQPDGGVLDEAHRRDEHCRDPEADGGDDEPDQPHVVVQRQPRHGDVVRAVGAQSVTHDGRAVRCQASVRHHHSLGERGAAGRELEEGHLVVAHVGSGWKRAGILCQLCGRQHLLDTRDPADRRPQHLGDALGRDQDPGLRDVEDAHQGIHERVQLAERDRRVERYRDQSTPKRAEECGDELLSLGYHQRYPVAAPDPGRRVMSGAPLGGEAKIMKGNEEILAGTSGAYEGETARMLAFASVQGRDDADHGRPV